MNTNENTLNAPVVLTEKVKNLKLIARNALRMELISPILAEINRLERGVKEIDGYIATELKKVAVAEYKITRLERLDAEHPDFDNLKKTQEENIEYFKKNLENLTKETEMYTKRIEDERTAITKIETGETLVSTNRLEEIVDRLILQDAKNDIVS